MRRLENELPLLLIMDPERKNYSRAVRDGFARATSDWVLAIDSDGQCDPKDFQKFWEKRSEADILMGWRYPRHDPWIRKFFSTGFKLFYRTLFGVKVHDPSCPYLLMKREVVKALLPKLGVLEQGFWWEYVARAHRAGFRIQEIKIHHRLREGGKSRVYRWNTVAKIGITHLMGLVKIRNEA